MVSQDDLDSDADVIKQPLLANWTLTELNENSLSIKLEFQEPLAISQEDKSDLLLMNLALSDFEDENG